MPDSRFFPPFSPIKLKDLASKINAEVIGDPDLKITSVGTLSNSDANTLTFFTNEKYTAQFRETKAGACIVAPSLVEYAPQGVSLLVAENPYAVYAKVLQILYPSESLQASIAKTAVVSKTASIGANVTIGEFSVIEDGVEIGDGTTIDHHVVLKRGVKIGSNCYISSHVTISHTLMGDRALIHPGASIGQDGFGFATDKGFHHKVKQLGRVVIGNDVEIGANTTIDRGAGPDTVIGDNCMIDNLVQLGHNVELKRGCVIVSQTGIAGSTKLGQFVVTGGQVGIAGHLIIGDQVQLAAKSGVHKNLQSGQIYGGIPAIPIRQWRRLVGYLNRIAKGEQSE